MGVFNRISDIVSSNIVSMLDKAEDPEKMVRLIIQEMEETLVEVKSSAAKLIAEMKGFERQLANLDAESQSWEDKAELAISKGREDLARGALAEKLKIAKQHQAVMDRSDESKKSLDQLRADIKELSNKLEEAKQRQRAIVIRKQSLTSQAQIQQTLERSRSAKAFEKFDQYEANLNRMEGDIVASRMGQSNSKSLSDELDQLKDQDSIEHELIRLKSKAFKSLPESQEINVEQSQAVE